MAEFDELPKAKLPMGMKKLHSSPTKSGTRKLELSAITDFENEDEESDIEGLTEQVKLQQVQIQLHPLPANDN